jgi:hypothetical protein
MSSIKETGFWTKLLKKIFRIIAKNTGIRTRPASHNQHVVPHEDGWAIKGEGNEKYTAVYKLQADAIKRAKDIAQNYKSDVIIHGRDGAIRDRMSYR